MAKPFSSVGKRTPGGRIGITPPTSATADEISLPDIMNRPHQSESPAGFMHGRLNLRRLGFGHGQGTFFAGQKRFAKRLGKRVRLLKIIPSVLLGLGEQIAFNHNENYFAETLTSPN